MAFLFLAGLGICVLGTVLIASVILAVAAPGAWPSLPDSLLIATVVIAMEVFLGTAMACLCGLAYNYTARFSGGVQVDLTDDLTDPAPVTEALGLARRLQARARERLRGAKPVPASAGDTDGGEPRTSAPDLDGP
ncbi:hypothetical protein WN71_026250 [Streptomyces mangrovisoli]|uniref:DUF3566 domain-containing protein n=2 Tax=Streptomyces mangrovisoli TaxID=1428628 RepID=A0A1J4NRP5_9ACTN|nr:hypothetical protein WN71_026250 [Streptomyces mangrovisoli]